MIIHSSNFYFRLLVSSLPLFLLSSIPPFFPFSSLLVLGLDHPVIMYGLVSLRLREQILKLDCLSFQL